MVSPVCSVSNLQIERRIVLTGADQWTVQHQLTNMGSQFRLAGIWSVMMTSRPAAFFYLLNPCEPITTVFGDASGALSIADGTAQVRCNGMREFKLGTTPKTGVVVARIENGSQSIWLISQMSQPCASTEYSHGHALEFFNSGHYDYAETEWHSPCRNLAPKEQLLFNMKFHIIQGRDDLMPTQLLNTGTDPRAYI